MSAFAYDCGIQFTRALFWIISRIYVEGEDRIPTSGPCLLVANHISHFDPNLLAMRLSRSVDYMATAELFEHPITGFFCRVWNAFPVDRTKVDRQAVRTVLNRLKDGKIIGIFPERGIRHGAASILHGASLPTGTASLVSLAGVPVVPAVIIGSDQIYQWRSWWHRPRIFIAYGVPFFPEKGMHREKIAEKIEESLRILCEALRNRHAIREREMPHSAQERWQEQP